MRTLSSAKAVLRATFIASEYACTARRAVPTRPTNPGEKRRRCLHPSARSGSQITLLVAYLRTYSATGQETVLKALRPIRSLIVETQVVEAPTTGSIIANRYRLLRKLGAGGMGAVWLAHDQSLDSQCAIKLVDRDKAVNEEVRVRFEREAKAAAQIRGTHVVDIFDHGVWDGIPFIAMEYLQGEDLGARLDRVGCLDVDQTYQIVAQVARALVRAHAAGIVHRDLKPENIFLVPDDDHEVAKVLDFGIAKHEQYSLAGKTTKTGSFMGTPYYMSPEQARGKTIDYRSDLWALGVIVFQCLTGRPPFESDALGELMGMIIYDPIPTLTSRSPLLPARLDEWWLRAVSRDREGRFQSAKELADAYAEAISSGFRLAVPSIPPRPPLGSLVDGDASGGYPRQSGYPDPTSADASARFSAPGILNDASQIDEGTGAPVTHTRFSALPVLARLPKRQRLAVLSLGAALVVILGFLLVAALRGNSDAVASANGAPSASVLVTREPPKRVEPPVLIMQPPKIEQDPDKDLDKKKKRSSTSAPAPHPPEATRDYGI